jgi:hypothetical protein
MSTTERYIYAKARKEDAERLNRAFGVTRAPIRAAALSAMSCTRSIIAV